GGEEFVICMPETSLDEALITAERMRTTINSTKIETPNGDSKYVTLSIGVSSFPLHGTKIAHLISASDKAMYHAKNSGRNRVEAVE
ncbi:MAG: GGDEF domain-containing protein, partial [Pseudomonadales bacterium]|nr:GGDEF domain-containing protein [Pseudomonadales bacterium]